MAERRRLPLWALLAAQAISVTGNRIALLAIPWFVLQSTGDVTRTGLAAAMNTLPAVVAGLLGGPLIERLGYRTTSVVADVASGATILAIPLLHAAGALEYPVLLALVFLGALFDAPGETARRALLPELAEQAGMVLDRAVSLHETTFRTTQLVGAPLAGLLIAAVGPARVLLVDAASFAASAVLVALLVRLPVAPVRPEGEAAGYLREIADAWRFLAGHRLLRSEVVVFVGANLLENGLVLVLLPTLVDRVHGEPVVLGLAVGAIGAGALLGVAAYGLVAGRTTRRAVLVPALVIAGAPKFLLLAAFPSAPVLVAGMLVLSIAVGPVNPISGAIEYELIPRAMRGRVFGLLGVAFIGAAAVGALAAGAAVGLLGLRPALLLGAALYAVLTIVPIVHPAWQDLDDLTPG